MKRRILTILALIGMATMIALQTPLPAGAATTKDVICQGTGTVEMSVGCTGGPSLTTVIRNIIKIFSAIIGVVAVIMVMVAGFKYVTAGGDSGNISSAKNTLVYAIVGLIVVALSQAIVKFVLQETK